MKLWGYLIKSLRRSQGYVNTYAKNLAYWKKCFQSQKLYMINYISQRLQSPNKRLLWKSSFFYIWVMQSLLSRKSRKSFLVFQGTYILKKSRQGLFSGKWVYYETHVEIQYTFFRTETRIFSCGYYPVLLESCNLWIHVRGNKGVSQRLVANGVRFL